MSPALINWLLLLSLVLIWGTSFMFTALSLDSFSPLFTTHLRLVLGALTLLACVYFKGLRFPVAWKDTGIFLLLGLVGNALPFFLISWGQQEVPSGTAGVLMAVMPMMTLILAHIWVDNERLNRFKLLGVITGFSGVYLLLRPDSSAVNELLHPLAILLAACCYAANTILVRRLSSHHPLVGGAGMLLGASILTLPFFLFFESLPQAPAPSSVIALIWLGLIPTGLASMVYFTIIHRAGPSFLSNLNFLVPVVAFFTGALLLNEPLTLSSLIALGIILSGIFLTRLRT